MSETSIEHQIVCLDNLLAKIKQVPINAETLEYQLNLHIKALTSKGLPTDLENKFRKEHLSHINGNMRDLCERMSLFDIPFLEETRDKLEQIRRR